MKNKNKVEARHSILPSSLVLTFTLAWLLEQRAVQSYFEDSQSQPVAPQQTLIGEHQELPQVLVDHSDISPETDTTPVIVEETPTSFAPEMIIETAFELESQPTLSIPNQWSFPGTIDTGTVGAVQVPGFPKTPVEPLIDVSSVMFMPDPKMFSIIGLAVLGLVGAAALVGASGHIGDGGGGDDLIPPTTGGPNRPPIAQDVNIFSWSDGNDSLYIPKAGLLRFVTDADNDALTLTISNVTDGTYNGTVDDSFKITPDDYPIFNDVNSYVTFDFTATDGKGGSDTAMADVFIQRQGGPSGATFVMNGTGASEILLVQNSNVTFPTINGNGGNDFIQVSDNEITDDLVVNGGSADDVIVVKENDFNLAPGNLTLNLVIASGDGSDTVVLNDNTMIAAGNGIASQQIISAITSTGGALDLTMRDTLISNTITNPGTSSPYLTSFFIQSTNTIGGSENFLIEYNTILVTNNSTTGTSESALNFYKTEDGTDSSDTVSIKENVLRGSGSGIQQESLIFQSDNNNFVIANDFIEIIKNEISSSGDGTLTNTAQLAVFFKNFDDSQSSNTILINENEVETKAGNTSANARIDIQFSVNNNALLNDSLTIDGNEVRAAAYGAILVDFVDTNLSADSLTVAISNNYLQGDEGARIEITADDQPNNTFSIDINNNELVAGLFDSYILLNTKSQSETITINDNVLSGIDDSYIDSFLTSSSGTSFTANNNNITASTDLVDIYVYTFGVGNDTVEVNGNTLATTGTTARVRAFSYDGNDTITVENNTLTSTGDAYIKIVPGTGDDTIDMGGLTNVVSGAVDPEDMGLYFTKGDGSDRVINFDPSGASINIHFFGLNPAITTFTQLQADNPNAVVQSGSDVILNLDSGTVGGNPGDTVTLVGLTEAQLADDDFLFN